MGSGWDHLLLPINFNEVWWATHSASSEPKVNDLSVLIGAWLSTLRSPQAYIRQDPQLVL